MKNIFLVFWLLLFNTSLFPQQQEKFDAPGNAVVPDFYKSKLSDIEAEIKNVKNGEVKTVATSPGGLPVYAVYYGEKDDFNTVANYSSAVGAGNPAFFAQKDSTTKPVFYFVGPYHGQEVEGIVGLVNLIHIAETGKDHRGRKWPELKNFIEQSRVIIIPCGNPDGRKRNPYDSFVSVPQDTMTKYAQGTKKDGSFWRWRPSKSNHPMNRNVDILGAYFNNDGINIGHDNFFFPMAQETKAILKIAGEEVPDITALLHSCSCEPFIAQNKHAPLFIRKSISELSHHVNQQYIQRGLPHQRAGWEIAVDTDENDPPPKYSFGLTDALHFISGTMSFLFESPQGTIEKPATHDEILDVQLVLYQEMFKFTFENRIYWTK